MSEHESCPHCPDGHDDPRTKPWSVWVAPARDGDGQPTTLHVAPSNSSHVAESDAEWLRGVIREARAKRSVDDAFEALRRDVQAMYARIGAILAPLRPASPDPRDEQIDAQRQEIARLRAIVTQIALLPREPEAVTDDERGEAYLWGWQDARALVDKALLPEDSVIDKGAVVDEEIHNGDEGRGE